jgi:hypothetical protein
MRVAKAKVGNARLVRAGAVALGLVAASTLAWADGHVYDVSNPKYRSECGSCHVPYPPALLPAAAWEKMMAGLNKHFGTDATLDAASAKEVSDFLARNAGRSRHRERDHDHERDHDREHGRDRDRDRSAAGDANTLRISETRWFQHEHSEDLSPAVWKSPKVKTPANCGACHTRAEQGDYDERSLRVPR